MLKDGVVYLEQDHAAPLQLPIAAFSEADQAFIQEKYQYIQALNSQKYENREGVNPIVLNANSSVLSFGFFFLFALLVYTFIHKNKRIYWTAFAMIGILITFLSLKSKTIMLLATDPKMVDSAFMPFKPHVFTRWDQTYFYVESKGIPTTHSMMTGITGWQQQVPIPQCYTGTNAWSIPLNPVIAATPVPVNASHFTRGAIALAVNGIAIFNPFTNTGVDALVDGQLDNWGGHCGRADDYHYHTAPLHLYGTTATKLPIAYALDGFAVYGALEPTGAAMTTLDANHGHYLNGVYHYHGTTAFPYMIGNMVGQVNEDATMQIIPQAQAAPIRPAGTPLRGATLTNFVANGANGYTLTYTLSGQTYQWAYNWTNAGVYNFNFIAPTGTTTATYNGFRQCTIQTDVADVKDDTESMSIYPNPTQHAFSLQLDKTVLLSGVQNISIVSAAGQVVYVNNTYQNSISTQGFAKGIYFVVVKTSKNSFVKKLVVE